MSAFSQWLQGTGPEAEYSIMKHTVEQITHAGKLLAIIVPSGFQREGIEFFTLNEFSQQLAYMNRPAGYRIRAHLHNPVRREVVFTQEVIFVRSGKVAVEFYSEEREYVGQRIVASGDVVMLVSGGHGLKMLEPSEIIEVKQGPYTGDQDKELFNGIGE